MWQKFSKVHKPSPKRKHNDLNSLDGEWHACATHHNDFIFVLTEKGRERDREGEIRREGGWSTTSDNES